MLPGGAEETARFWEPRGGEALGAVDLFSGAGGFSLGLEGAGFRPLLGLDLYEPAARTYRANFPQAGFVQGDARKVKGSDLKALLGGVRPAVLTAGIPCQGFSLMGKRNPQDERNHLFLELLRFVEALEPEAVVVENVPGMRSLRTPGGKGTFAQAVGKALKALGYAVRLKELAATDYGVPQVRRRLFFVALPPQRAFVWPAPRPWPPPTVWEAIGDLPPLEPGERATAYDREPHSPYAQRMREGAGEILWNHEAPRHTEASRRRIASARPGEPFYPSFPQRLRLHPERPSPTVIAGGSRPQYYFAHPFQVRGLTVRETARLQSFPDRFRFLGGKVAERILVGNAVPPLLAQALGEAIRRALLGESPEGVPFFSEEEDALPLFASGSG